MELIREITRGSAGALGALYGRHAGSLLLSLKRILGNPQEAEDVLHEVFLEVWERAADYDPTRGTVRAWLVTRARSRALDRLRALARLRSVSNVANDDIAHVADSAPTAAPADAFSVRRALSNLAPELQKLLELGYFEGMSSAEIAAHEELAIGTVKSRVARALAELRRALRHS
ncbi:MAG TPA: sigma-70 family RNA polymerase sigma factor [Polyangiaceae bacterium]|nr:sigma-70 family RNA polymerase sigma factor [Polyangiaceae bacterium]